jgi:hypothetical protein
MQFELLRSSTDVWPVVHPPRTPRSDPYVDGGAAHSVVQLPYAPIARFIAITRKTSLI